MNFSQKNFFLNISQKIGQENVKFSIQQLLPCFSIKNAVTLKKLDFDFFENLQVIIFSLEIVE